MWVPKSAKEIEDAAKRGDLEETSALDAKVALPAARRNHDLAVDVCAMTVAGGSLIYGLGEDENKQLTVLAPLSLGGAADRVAQVVETSISEPPFIRIETLPSEADPGEGYLLVVVPPSDRAPHQVISGGDMRYYGRGAKGNRILSEVEVAGLYARREHRQVDRERVLDEELALAPEADPRLGYAVAFARPVVPDDAMVDRVASSAEEVLKLLVDGSRTWGDVREEQGDRSYDPDLRKAFKVWRRGTVGWRLTTGSEFDPKPSYTARIDLDFDGTGHFFCGRVADTDDSRPEGVKVLFEVVLAGNLASFFAAMGALYDAADYVGQVDVGAAVTGIEGAAPWGLHHWGENKFSGPPPRRTARVSAAELADNPKGIALALIRVLLDATRGDSSTPFDEDFTGPPNVGMTFPTT